jgi:hypothetical protein
MKFQIRARKREGKSKVEQFKREASNTEELISELQAEGYLILSVHDIDASKQGLFQKKLQGQGQKKGAKKFSDFALFETVKGHELLSFFV